MKKKYYAKVSIIFFIFILVFIVSYFQLKNINELKSNNYTPNQIKKAYGLDKISFHGSNQKIAIVVAYGSKTILNDLSVFNKKFNLCETNLQISYPEGTPDKIRSEDIPWIKETTMDVEWSHALAPKAKILLVIAKSSTKNDLLEAIQYAVNNSADIISISWRYNEFKNEYKYNKYFNNTDITYIASSGDNGPEVSWPSVHPNVLAVGGTTLNLTNKGKIISNPTACFNSGGGISKYFYKPNYQNQLINKSIHYRSVPDVSFFGDTSKGVSVYCSNSLIDKKGWFELSGTSLGAPCWSAFMAIVNEAHGTRIKNIHEKLYDIAKNDKTHTNFYDIVEGNNGQFYTKNGYDCVTGLGSPHFNVILKSLLSKKYD